MFQSAPETRRLYRQIAEQLRSRIAAGEYPTGSRLPPERDLALQLGVSRPTVREAVIALEVEGFVEVRMGSGIYVVDGTVVPEADTSSAFGPLEIIRARQVVERELAAQVARSPRRSVAAIGLREAIAEMEVELARGMMPIAGDRRFHLCLAEACDNAPLLRVVSDLYDERANPLFERFGRLFEDLASWRNAVTEHRAVAEAVAEGDAARARTAMHVHLELTHERFTAAWADEPDARRTRAEAHSL